ncbi:MAG TPA: hypothetical protein VGP82_24480 [Ktedonobacterales bacterium]|nr:hypothetical protein [Ktedonobacterales bacterium]
MAKKASTWGLGAARAEYIAQPPRGSVRSCMPYRDELAHHRVISADGHDVAVATIELRGSRTGYLTSAYPVQQGYLVMVRQPLCELQSVDVTTARQNQERLVRVLAEAGVGVVRARKTLAARRRAEGKEAREGGTFTLAAELFGADMTVPAPAGA